MLQARTSTAHVQRKPKQTFQNIEKQTKIQGRPTMSSTWTPPSSTGCDSAAFLLQHISKDLAHVRDLAAIIGIAYLVKDTGR